MEYKDYYKILGVDRNASDAEIKREYRKLARQLHPDVNPGDQEAENRFKEINEAYQVLGDKEKREKYDHLGSSWQQWQHTGQDPNGFDWSQWFTPGAGRPQQGGVRVEFQDLSDLFGDAQSGGFSDFFNSLFGGMPGGQRPRSGYTRTYNRPARGQNLEQAIDITLDEAYHGTARTLVRDGKRIQANIPAGAKTGTKVRLSGQGAPGPGGPQGDLYLKINVLPHETFQRQGNDLHMDVEIDLYPAVLGGETTIPTFDGNVALKIPAGTQNGQVFRLRGKGMPDLRDPQKRGDLYARAQVRLPKKLSSQETELFQQLAALKKR